MKGKGAVVFGLCLYLIVLKCQTCVASVNNGIGEPPKHPPTAFFAWMNDNEEKLREGNPDMMLPELVRKARKAWDALSDDDKARFQIKAEAAKLKYQEEMAEYKRKLEKKNKGSTKKPKRPLSAYHTWLAKIRDQLIADYPDLSQPELARKSAQIWRNLDDSEKIVFLEKAKKAMAEYTKQLDEYNRKKGKLPKNDDVNAKPEGPQVLEKNDLKNIFLPQQTSDDGVKPQGSPLTTTSETKDLKMTLSLLKKANVSLQMQPQSQADKETDHHAPQGSVNKNG